MNNDYNHSIEVWVAIFEKFQRVEHVTPVFDADQLDIKIKGQEDILHASREELNDSLYAFINLDEVVAYFLKKHGIFVVYYDTLVGYFDIQAYSDYIEQNQTKIEQAIRKIGSFFDNVIRSRTDAYAVKIDHWILSDSVIIVVDTNRSPLFSGSLDFFLGTCSMIMYEAVTMGFPLRGAIGGGYFYKDGEIMVSSGLVDAAKYEKEQDWL